MNGIIVKLDNLETAELHILQQKIKKEIACRDQARQGEKILGFTLVRCKQRNSYNWQAYGYVGGHRLVVSLGKSLRNAEKKIKKHIEKKGNI